MNHDFSSHTQHASLYSLAYSISHVVAEAYVLTCEVASHFVSCGTLYVNLAMEEPQVPPELFGLCRLPEGVIQHITNNLPEDDCKALRQTCRY